MCTEVPVTKRFHESDRSLASRVECGVGLLTVVDPLGLDRDGTTDFPAPPSREYQGQMNFLQ